MSLTSGTKLGPYEIQSLLRAGGMGACDSISRCIIPRLRPRGPRMCGIVALFSRRDPVSPAVMQGATQSLYHRGPDGQRHWISRDHRVALGHARLSIIDLTTGDQPIASEDELTRIIVNGEFYGYESIQRELEQGGHRLRTRSDSEIALHLYEDLGAHCLHRLR